MRAIKRETFDKYISAHGKNLTRLCLKLCRERGEAEDLYQETWCRVAEKIRFYDEAKPFEPWLFTVCLNIFKNACNKAKKRPLAFFESDREMERALNNAAAPQPFFNEEHDLLHQIVGELEEKHRAAVALHYFGDYSLEQIANILGIPRGTVKSRLHKAREIIRRRLEDHDK